MASTISAIDLIDSDGVTHDWEMVYSKSDNTLEFVPGGADGGWYLSNSKMSGFFEAVGHDTDEVSQINKVGGGEGFEQRVLPRLRRLARPRRLARTPTPGRAHADTGLRVPKPGRAPA